MIRGDLGFGENEDFNLDFDLRRRILLIALSCSSFSDSCLLIGIFALSFCELSTANSLFVVEGEASVDGFGDRST